MRNAIQRNDLVVIGLESKNDIDFILPPCCCQDATAVESNAELMKKSVTYTLILTDIYIRFFLKTDCELRCSPETDEWYCHWGKTLSCKNVMSPTDMMNCPPTVPEWDVL